MTGVHLSAGTMPAYQTYSSVDLYINKHAKWDKNRWLITGSWLKQAFAFLWGDSGDNLGIHFWN